MISAIYLNSQNITAAKPIGKLMHLTLMIQNKKFNPLLNLSLKNELFLR